MSSKQEHPIQAMGFWMFGFLSVVLAVLKLTVAGYWSWWRVMRETGVEADSAHGIMLRNPSGPSAIS